MKMTSEWLNRKQLIGVLGVSRWFLYAMEKNGFKMINGRAKEADALVWLFLNPHPVATLKKARKAKKPTPVHIIPHQG